MSFKFELDRLTDYSTADIVNEIQRVADLLGVTPLKKRDFDSESKVHSSTVIRRFGSWRAGLEAAERGQLYGGGTVTDKMRAQKGRDLSDDDLLTELRRVAQVLGRGDLTIDDINNHSIVGQGIFRKRFGTTRIAMERAGLTVRPQSRRYTDDECFENLFEVWRHYGRRPSFSEINRSPSKVGGEAYIRRFGTWMKALAAFVERVNAKPDSAPGPIAPTPSREASSGEKSSRPINSIRDERRDIPLGLRFRVLSRDKFKCVKCGDHPARNPDCDLHVDHITPWSRGGRTEFVNLRTLCAQCNVGRSNRYDADDNFVAKVPIL
ncbi:MAG: HNH endonuclease [Acidobacteriota bacterium]|nr:HNH endonuclease [Acidobacteriota bacterium]